MVKGYAKIDRDVIFEGVNTVVNMPCRVQHVGNSSFGKLPKDAVTEQIIMEYKHFLPHLARFLPNGPLNNNQKFKEYLFNKGSEVIYELSDYMMMTLPSPRVEYYQSSNYYQI